MTNVLKKLPFYSQKWFQFLLFLVGHFIEDDCPQKAASLTYTTLLSIVPILTVLLVILSSVPALENVREELQAMIYSNLLPQSSIQVSQYINDFAEKSSNLTAIGILVLFVTTIMTLVTIEGAFNKIWRVKDQSGGLRTIVRYWTFITLGPIVLGTAFIVSGTVQSLSFLNKQIAGYGIDWSIWIQLISVGITMAGFVGMYWFIPRAQVPFRNALIAGVITALVFEMLKQIFGAVMSNFTSYEAIYGAFAALPIFLLWIYLSWNLILLGVEISYTLTIFETKEVYPRHPLFSLLDMLNLLYKNYQKGRSVSEQSLRDVLGRHELPKWSTYISYLKECNLVATTEHDRYVIKQDLGSISLWQFYQTLPYPLPTQEDMETMNTEHYDPWFAMLIKRFKISEQETKAQLNIPLAQIFNHTPVRKKVEDEPLDVLDELDDDKVSPIYPESDEPEANASKTHDESIEKKASVTAPSTDLKAKSGADDNATSHVDRVDSKIDGSTKDKTDTPEPAEKKSSKLLEALRNKRQQRQDVISDADKPE